MYITRVVKMTLIITLIMTLMFSMEALAQTVTPIPETPGVPTAQFKYSPYNGVSPLWVSFTDTSTGVPTNWSWDFQDDGVEDSTLENPLYSYVTPGTYSVKLNVSNSFGNSFVTKYDIIVVVDQNYAYPTQVASVQPILPKVNTTSPMPTIDTSYFDRLYFNITGGNMTDANNTSASFGSWDFFMPINVITDLGAPYNDATGGLFSFIIIAGIALSMYVVQGSTLMPGLLLLTFGTLLSAYIPYDWARYMLIFTMLGIVGILYAIFRSE